MDDRAGKSGTTGRNDPSAALAMLSLFAGVGAKFFDLSFTDLDGKPVKGQQRPGRSLEEIRRRIGRDLQDSERNQHNVIIRPRSTTALLIQLDDCDQEKVERIQPYSFLTLQTSPGNFQVWLAVSDAPKESDEEAARLFRIRVRRGTAADHSATGATRIAGSLNVKKKFVPAFPVVTMTHMNVGGMTTVAALEQAGFIAPPEQQLPAASVPPQMSQPGQKPTGPRRWPDYQQALRGAPRKQDGKPDRSLADFMWCKWAAERGWSIEQTAEKLAEVSTKAQERIRWQDDKGYTVLTARNAAVAINRDPKRRQP